MVSFYFFLFYGDFLVELLEVCIDYVMWIKKCNVWGLRILYFVVKILLGMYFIYILGEEVLEGVDVKMLSVFVVFLVFIRVSLCFLFFVYDMMFIFFRIVFMYCFVIKFIVFLLVMKGIFFWKFLYFMIWILFWWMVVDYW